MLKTLNNYKPSGRVNPVAPLFLAVGLLLTLALSFLYAYLIENNPFIYLSLLIFAGFVIGLAMISIFTVSFGKIRNVTVGIIIGLLTGLTALYVSWAVILPAIVGDMVNTRQLLTSPDQMWHLINFISRAGWYSIFGVEIHGFLLWLIWGLEALGIVLVPVYSGYDRVKSHLFCENCKTWSVEENNFLCFYYPDKQLLLAQLQRGDLSFFQQANAIELPPEKNFYALDIEKCESCKNIFTLALVENEKDKDDFIKQLIIKGLLIDKTLYEQLREKQPLFPAVSINN